MKHEITYLAGGMVQVGDRQIVPIEKVSVLRMTGVLSIQKTGVGLLITEGEEQYLFPFFEEITPSWVEEHLPGVLRSPL
jgi:hypothetical protein